MFAWVVLGMIQIVYTGVIMAMAFVISFSKEAEEDGSDKFYMGLWVLLLIAEGTYCKSKLNLYS